MVVLGYNTDPDALTICNGYKDDEYMRLALLGRKLGRKVVVVIEKLSELPALLRAAEEVGVEPWIGLRSKLSTRGTGKWESSSGDFAKFGLTTPEMIEAVRILEAAGKKHLCKLFHFHVGSQLTEIRVVKDAVNEGARLYAKLRKMGLGIEYFDVGGGLGVDYVGSRSAGVRLVDELHARGVRRRRHLQRAAHLRERGGPRAAHRLASRGAPSPPTTPASS